MTQNKQVSYRPGRIQTINAEQEVILKQVWANMLKYWGYSVDISDEDLAFKESFVASTTTTAFGERSRGQEGSNGLERVSTKGSIGSGSTDTSKKKGLFLRKTAEPAKPPATSKRMKQIQTESSSERYVPVEQPSEEYKYIFCNFYGEGNESDDCFETESDASSDLSLEPFITALSSITDPGTEFTTLPTSKTDQSAPPVNGATISQFKVKQHTKLLPCLSKYEPSDMHSSYFSILRNDLIDNVLLRFVRARKFKYDDAITMLTKSLNWRQNELKVSDYFFEGDAPSYLNNTNEGFIKNFTVAKCYLRGQDRERNPVVLFRAKLNYSADSPLDDTKRYAIVTIEWCRMFLKEVTDSVDQCSVVFDLTGFSLKNNDLPAIKFLAEIFEAHYPEILGKILIHNAPWIFSTIWNIIKNWLDPVVASKIHFTKNVEELSNFIEKKHIPDYMGGKDEYTGQYPEPLPEHGRPSKKKDATYFKIKQTRDDDIVKFLDTTRKWVESTNPEVSARYLQDKIDLETRAAQGYVDLDSYIRIPGIYDRNGAFNISI